MSKAQIRMLAKWIPLLDYLRLNVDGTLFFNQTKVGIGLILRNAVGKTQLSVCMAEAGICEPNQIELLAILRGLQIYLGLGIRKSILESDCLQMINECLSRVTSYSKTGSMVVELRKIQTSFTNCILQHTYREHNEVAHFLAHHA